LDIASTRLPQLRTGYGGNVIRNRQNRFLASIRGHRHLWQRLSVCIATASIARWCGGHDSTHLCGADQESFLLRCLSHEETDPERDASPRVDLPGFYPAVYPGLIVRDCLSRPSTENKLSRNPRGTFYPAGANSMPAGHVLTVRWKKPIKTAMSAREGSWPSSPATVNSHQDGATMPQFRSQRGK